MPRFLLTLLAFVLLNSCSGPRYVDYFPYHDDGTAKPKIALLPCIDISRSNLPENLSQEFTQGIRYRAMHNGELYLLPDHEIYAITNNLGDVDFFGSEVSFAKKFCHADFVVALELFGHEVTPYSCMNLASDECFNEENPGNSLLKMKIRIKIIDVRDDKPQVILQEIINSNQVIAPNSGTFQTSYGIAHKSCIRDIVERIENVTWGAR